MMMNKMGNPRITLDDIHINNEDRASDMLWRVSSNDDLRPEFLKQLSKDRNLMKELNIILRGDKIKKIVDKIGNTKEI